MNIVAMRRKMAHFTASEWAKPQTLFFRIAKLSVCYDSASERRFLSYFASGCNNVHTDPSADAKLLLARLAQQSGDTVIAQQHTETALQRAIADGPPDHCYRATYDEALALLKILAREQP
jgi:hypothetical protein